MFLSCAFLCLFFPVLAFTFVCLCPGCSPCRGAVGVASSPAPRPPRPPPAPPLLLSACCLSGVVTCRGRFEGHPSLGWALRWCPLPVFAAGALGSSSGEGFRGASSPAARLFVLSSKPCSRQAIPAKVTRTFRRAGSKVASLLLSHLRTSAHRKPPWVPFTLEAGTLFCAPLCLQHLSLAPSRSLLFGVNGDKPVWSPALEGHICRRTTRKCPGQSLGEGGGTGTT